MTLSVACRQSSLLQTEEAFKANCIFVFSFLSFFFREDNQKRQEKKVLGKKDKHIISKNKYNIICWFSYTLLFQLLMNCFIQVVKYSYLYVTQKEMWCPGEANSWFADCLQAVNCNLNIFAIHRVDKQRKSHGIVSAPELYYIPV